MRYQNNERMQQQPNYQNITLPDSVYDYVYPGRQPITVALRAVEGYVNQIQQEIGKFRDEYQVHIVETQANIKV